MAQEMLLQRCALNEKFPIAEKALTQAVKEGGWSSRVEGAGDRRRRSSSCAVKLLPNTQVLAAAAEAASEMLLASLLADTEVLLHRTTGALKAECAELRLAAAAADSPGTKAVAREME